MAAFEYSGIAKSLPLDTATSMAYSNLSGPVNFTSGASITHSAGDLIIGYAGCNYGEGAVSIVSTFTQIQNNPNGGCDIVESTIAGMAGLQSTVFNIRNNNDGNYVTELMAAFRPALTNVARREGD